MMSARNGWATTTRIRTASYQTIPRRNRRRWRALDHSMWNRQTSAPTKHQEIGHTEVGARAPDPLDQDAAGQHDDGHEDRISHEDAEGEDERRPPVRRRR